MRQIFFRLSKPRFVDEKEIIKEIKILAKKIARKKRAVKAIYLFGSYAKSNAGVRSDADILVVLSQDKRHLIDRAGEFIMDFSNGPVPIDVLVYTQAELKKAIREGNRFLACAVKGIRLV